MSLLFKIVYAAHANGTHHKLALDALNNLTMENAEDWRRLFLKNAELYLEGSKAPDKEFKDFKNHVLHVRDSYWGGAPEKVENWYGMLVRALREKNWSEAVWCAGVLSHYYTDPIHPFHTAQSAAENNIHRAVEWSISKSYDSLRTQGLAGPAPAVHAGTGEHWLKDFAIAGAETSNRHYDTLIAHYDFKRGVVEPPEGLDDVCRAAVAELLIYAATGFSVILERAIAEAGVEPPRVSLSVETVLATLKIPVKWVTRKMSDAADRRQVEAMYDELQATGHVDATLSEDDRTVRDLYDREVRPLNENRQQRDRMRRRETSPRPSGALPFVAGNAVAKPSAAIQPPTPSPTSTPEPAPEVRPVPEPQVAAVQPARSSVPIVTPLRAAKARSEEVARPEGDGPGRTIGAHRFFLKPEDDVEAAPSIGPRTAERLYKIGIRTVAELLAADANEISDRLDARHLTPKAVTDWQDQSRLVMEIPDLRGTHAQLLVGAGLRSSDAVAEADPATVQSAILHFVGTAEGQRILRDGTPPDIEKITGWLDRAREVRAA